MIGLTLAAGDALPQTVTALLIILVAAAIVSVTMSRLGLAEIPAYLAAGVIIGPHALGLLPSEEAVAPVKELALILLMFGIGLHLDMSSFRGATRPLVLIGAVSTVLSAALCTLAAMAFGLGAPSAIAVGMALSISSTAVVLRLLQKRRELRRVSGRICFSTLIVQDLLVIVMLGALPALAATGAMVEEEAGEGGAMGVLAQVMTSIGGVGLMLMLGRFALPVILRQAARGSTEVLLVASAAIALIAAVATAALGLSPALGGFIAGFLLSSTPFRYHVSGQLASLRDLFLAVFFTSVGLGVDPMVVVSNWWVVALGLGLVLTMKAASVGATVWVFGASPVAAATCALYLAQAGEFSLVVLDESAELGLVGEAGYATIVAMVVLSLMVTPAMMNQAGRVTSRLARARPAPWAGRSALAPGEGHEARPAAHGGVIIAGFGPTGRALADGLDASDVPYTLIEMNPATVRTQKRLGRSVVFGDAGNEEVLESAGIRTAHAIVLTFPDDDAVLRAARAARALAPEIFIAARVGYLSRGMAARAMGVDHVVIEEIATAETIQRQVLEILRQRAIELGEQPPEAPAAGQAPDHVEDQAGGF